MLETSISGRARMVDDHHEDSMAAIRTVLRSAVSNLSELLELAGKPREEWSSEDFESYQKAEIFVRDYGHINGKKES